MADLTQQLADLNNNAKNLLSKYDGAFIRLNNESLKLMNEIDKKAKDAGDKIEKIVENTDLKSLGEEYKKLFDEKINELDNKEKEFSEKLTTALTDAKESVKAFDYMEAGKPTTKINPTKKNATWLDLSSGVIWVCVDNTKDKNKWISEKGEVKLIEKKDYGKVDIFNDGSCIAYFPLKNNLNDLGGKFYLQMFFKSGSFSPSYSSLGAYFQNDRYGLKINPAITVGEKYTLSFQGKAAGTQLDDNDQYMFTPKGVGSWNNAIFRPYWNKNKAYLENKQIPDLQINDNGYHSYTIVCDGANTTLYRDGKKIISTSQRYKNVSIGSLAGGDCNNFSGDAYDAWAGYLRNIRFFNRPLTPSEIEILSKEQ